MALQRLKTVEYLDYRKTNLVIQPKTLVPVDVQLDYWDLLKAYKRLEYRFGQTRHPDMEDAHILMKDNFKQLFYVAWESHLEQSVEIVGEFTINQRRGKTVECHFSTNPKNSMKRNREIGLLVVDQLLHQWRTYGNDNEEKGEPYCNTILGVIPQSHKASWRSMQELGFEIQAIIPDAIYFKGILEPAVLVMRTYDQARRDELWTEGEIKDLRV